MGEISWLVKIEWSLNRYITIICTCKQLCINTYKLSTGMMNITGGFISLYKEGKLYRIIQVGISEMWLLAFMVNVVKVPISSKFLFSHLILHFMQWTSVKKNFDLDEKPFCYKCLNTWKSYFLAVDPCRWSQHWHAQSCDVDSGTCEFRLDLSRLFYLFKFNFVVHAKCSFPAFCMNY